MGRVPGRWALIFPALLTFFLTTAFPAPAEKLRGKGYCGSDCAAFKTLLADSKSNFSKSKGAKKPNGDWKAAFAFPGTTNCGIGVRFKRTQYHCRFTSLTPDEAYRIFDALVEDAALAAPKSWQRERENYRGEEDPFFRSDVLKIGKRLTHGLVGYDLQIEARPDERDQSKIYVALTVNSPE